MVAEYQATIEKSFKNIKLASLLIIIELVLTVVFTVFLVYFIESIVSTAISKNIGAGMIEPYILNSLRSDISIIIVSTAIYMGMVGISIYSVYLYSRSVLLLSEYNQNLKKPAKYSKYLYLIILTVDILEFVFIILELYSMISMPFYLIYTVYIILAIAILLFVLYLYIGIYRIGVIYNNSSIRLGAIFYFIPLVDLLAPFLLYSGAKQLLVTYKK